VQGGDCLVDVAKKQVKGTIESGLARHDNVIACAERFGFDFSCKRRFEPSADAIARDGVSDFLGDRKAEARTAVLARTTTGHDCRPFTHFDQERGRGLTSPTAYSEKFGTRLERWQDRNDSLQEPQTADSGA
jgi:hypothetical protein